MDRLNELTRRVIGAAIGVHRELGPGLLESVYQRCLCIELDGYNVAFKAEVPVPVIFKGHKIQDEGFRADMLVEDQIVLELKSVETIKNVHRKQLLTYMKLMHKPLGLLINFNEAYLRDGIVRIINT